MVTYNVLGREAARADGPEKVTGAAKYGVDAVLPGTLWGKALRSPFPHARIRSIDTSRALQLPGVHAVLTGEDVRGVLIGRRLLDVPVLAYDHVRFVGEKVAAVAAEDEDTAQAALDLIEVAYEELPAVFDPEEAMRPGAPILHPDVNTYKGLPQPLARPSNAFVHNVAQKGDIEEGFAQAEVIVEATYRTPKVHQAYLEPHACLVWIDPEGRVQVWATNKAPFALRQHLAEAAQIPQERVRVNHAYIGGDFGGKGGPMDVPLCYFLAKAAGRPIKMVLDYTEELLAANPRHASTISIKAGARKDGSLVAWQARVIFNSGAYGGFKPVPTVNIGFQQVAGPYRIPHTRIDAYQVYTNTVPSGHFRAPGSPQSIFAGESHMDALARALGVDPFELRRRNIIREGDATPIGHHYQEVRAREALEEAVQAADYFAEKPPYVGRGIAMADHGAPGGENHARVEVLPSGDVMVYTSLFEQGAGQYTVLRQVVAEELTVPPGRVHVQPEDTDAVPFDTGIGGSRTTRVATEAAYRGARAARERLQRVAAELLGWAEERIALRDGRLVHQGTGQSIEIGALVARAGEPVVGRGHIQDTSPSPMTGFTAQVAEVAVDPQTGQMRVLRLTTAHDVGTVVHPTSHQGQIDGGVIQALGFAQMEELVIEDGRVANPSFADFKIPTARDIPELRTVLLESSSGMGPYKTKSIGESSNTPTAAAIANAVEDAVGVRIRDLPITAEKVYRALREKDGAH